MLAPLHARNQETQPRLAQPAALRLRRGKKSISDMPRFARAEPASKPVHKF
jgi:hypothetical protein